MRSARDLPIRNDPRTAYDVLLHGAGSTVSADPAHYQYAEQLEAELGIPLARFVGLTVSQGHGNTAPGVGGTHGPFQFRWRSQSLSRTHFENLQAGTPEGQFTQGVMSEQWASAVRTALIRELGRSEELTEVERQHQARNNHQQDEPIQLSREFFDDLIARHAVAKREETLKKVNALTDMAPPPARTPNSRHLRRTQSQDPTLLSDTQGFRS